METYHSYRLTTPSSLSWCLLQLQFLPPPTSSPKLLTEQTHKHSYPKAFLWWIQPGSSNRKGEGWRENKVRKPQGGEKLLRWWHAGEAEGHGIPPTALALATSVGFVKGRTAHHMLHHPLSTHRAKVFKSSSRPASNSKVPAPALSSRGLSLIVLF